MPPLRYLLIITVHSLFVHDGLGRKFNAMHSIFTVWLSRTFTLCYLLLHDVFWSKVNAIYSIFTVWYSLTFKIDYYLLVHELCTWTFWTFHNENYNKKNWKTFTLSLLYDFHCHSLQARINVYMMYIVLMVHINT